MQFNVITLVIAAMATVALAGETVTIYACASTAPTAVAVPLGVVSATVASIASTGVVTAPTSTGSPISYATGAASLNGVSALGMIVAGSVALFL